MSDRSNNNNMMYNTSSSRSHPPIDNTSYNNPNPKQQQPQQQDKFDRFEQWLRENGAKFEHLELRAYECATAPNNKNSNAVAASSSSSSSRMDEDNDNDNDDEEKKEQPSTNYSESMQQQQDDDNEEESEMRGVHAKKHILPNTICMSIPRRCLITVEMGQATPIGQCILKSDLDLDAPKHIFLMVFILWDRKMNGINSFFYPYYEILPRTLHNMPIFWNPQELNELHGSYLLHQIHDRNRAISQDYQSICTICPQFTTLCDLNEFKWARMCVCSRNFGLQMDGHRTSAMVPHADMLNHYRPRETKWTFDEDRQAFTITTLQHVMAGNEVLDSYGQKCNHRFLLNYGFAIEENRELDGFCPNECPVELRVSHTDPDFDAKLEFWLRGEHQSHPATATSANNNNNKGNNSKGGGGDSSSNNNNNNSHRNLLRPEQLSAATVKRVRICVSNNENTRLLFSLLRALACNPSELRAISQPSYTEPSTITTAAAAAAAAAASNTNHTSTSSRLLFGLPDVIRQYPTMSQQQHQQHQHQHQHQQIILTGSPAPVGATYHRSCRDVRHPISLRNEQQAMKLLLEIVHYHLSQYPTTLQQDIISLRNETEYPKFSNRRHAKIQVRGEKEVLHHFAVWAETALNVLDFLEQELAEEAGFEVRWQQQPQGGGSRHQVMVDAQPQHGGATAGDRTFDNIIRQMEEEDDESAVHHTILRYCADVLGSLRREELKNVRKRQQQQQQQTIATTQLGGRSNNNGKDRGSGGGSYL